MKISRTIIIIFLTFFCFQLSKANEKIAFINIDIIFQNSITGKKITQNLNDFKKKNLDELKLKEDENRKTFIQTNAKDVRFLDI